MLIDNDSTQISISKFSADLITQWSIHMTITVVDNALIINNAETALFWKGGLPDVIGKVNPSTGVTQLAKEL